MTACRDCASQPAGIAGHDNLFSQTMGWASMHFRCRTCGTVWIRTQEPDESYRWNPAAGCAGMDTPGRPGTAPP